MKNKIEEIDSTLQSLSFLTQEDKTTITKILSNQINVHTHCLGSIPISDTMLYIIGKEIEGIEYVKVFDNNVVVVETLDTSYTRMRNLTTLEDWNTRFILCVTFKDEAIQIKQCKISEIKPIEYKKSKELMYAVTDGKEVVKVNIHQQEIKDIEYRELRGMMTYTFNRKIKKNIGMKNLACILVKYN